MLMLLLPLLPLVLVVLAGAVVQQQTCGCYSRREAVEAARGRQ